MLFIWRNNNNNNNNFNFKRVLWPKKNTSSRSAGIKMRMVLILQLIIALQVPGSCAFYGNLPHSFAILNICQGLLNHSYPGIFTPTLTEQIINTWLSYIWMPADCHNDRSRGSHKNTNHTHIWHVQHYSFIDNHTQMQMWEGAAVLSNPQEILVCFFYNSSSWLKQNRFWHYVEPLHIRK